MNTAKQWAEFIYGMFLGAIERQPAATFWIIVALLVLALVF